jgi:glucose dehydrogenase
VFPRVSSTSRRSSKGELEGLLPPTEGIEVDYMLMPAKELLVDGLPIVKPPSGQITAIDLNRGEILWQIANADTPEEIATGRPARARKASTASPD